MQGLRGIAGEQGDAALTENRSGIDAGIDQMHGATGLRHPGLHGLPPCLQTSEGRKQRGVNVQDATREGVEQRLLDDPHEARKHHEIDPGPLEQSNQFSFGLR